MKTVVLICTGLGTVLGALVGLRVGARDKWDDKLGTLVGVLGLMIGGALAGAVVGVVLYHPLVVQTTWKQVSYLPFFEVYVLAVVFGAILFPVRPDFHHVEVIEWVGAYPWARAAMGWALDLLLVSSASLVVATTINGLWAKNGFVTGVIAPIGLIAAASILVPGLFYHVRRRAADGCVANSGWQKRQIPIWWIGLNKVPLWLSRVLGWALMALVASGSYVLLVRFIAIDAPNVLVMNGYVLAISAALGAVLLAISLGITLVVSVSRAREEVGTKG